MISGNLRTQKIKVESDSIQNGFRGSKMPDPKKTVWQAIIAKQSLSNENKKLC